VDNEQFLIKQYEILIGLANFHHKRWIDHWRTYLTMLTVIAGVIAAVIKMSDNVDYCGDIHVIIIIASILGLILCFIAWVSLYRIMNDYGIKHDQLRRIEDIIQSEVQDKQFIRIFNEGHQYFKDGVLNERKFRLKFLKGINQIVLASVAFILFGIIFIFMFITSL